MYLTYTVKQYMFEISEILNSFMSMSIYNVNVAITFSLLYSVLVLLFSKYWANQVLVGFLETLIFLFYVNQKTATEPISDTQRDYYIYIIVLALMLIVEMLFNITLYHIINHYTTLRNSSDTQVMLRRVTLQSTGVYKCEVSGEAPAFNTVSESETMTVVTKCLDG
ncbi:hypothetical protein GQX74_001892 [Glossina fuscipes]|nr:hypothetical protein GQX74_001892 [Glossina fuscipes]